MQGAQNQHENRYGWLISTRRQHWTLSKYKNTVYLPTWWDPSGNIAPPHPSSVGACENHRNPGRPAAARPSCQCDTGTGSGRTARSNPFVADVFKGRSLLKREDAVTKTEWNETQTKTRTGTRTALFVQVLRPGIFRPSHVVALVCKTSAARNFVQRPRSNSTYRRMADYADAFEKSV